MTAVTRSSGPSTSVSPGTSTGTITGSKLRRGSHGPEVASLQRALAAAGFDPGPIDGDFGPRTQKALKSFQHAHSLTADGVASPKTWGALGGGSFTSASGPVAAAGAVTQPTNADEVRAQVAQWAIAQANDPNIGYSQTKGRFGNATDSQGHRYFDCSGLCFTAYKQYGITLGGNWTGAMRQTASQWSDPVPKDLNQMKPGDLILMDGHVVMYTGNGKCVGAQTSHTQFDKQVTADISAQHYLNRPDAIVLRPRVSGEQVAHAPAGTPLTPSGRPPANPGGTSSSPGRPYSGTPSSGTPSSSGGRPSGPSTQGPSSDPGSFPPFGSDDDFFEMLLQSLILGDPDALIRCLKKRFPTASPAQLQAIARGLSPMAADLKNLQVSPEALQAAATAMSQGASVDEVSGSLFPQTAASEGSPGDGTDLNSLGDLQADPSLQAQLLSMPRTIAA